MKVSKVARKYIELAIRESIASIRPDYNSKFAQAVVDASMKKLDASKDILYRAIELAASDAACPGEKP